MDNYNLKKLRSILKKAPGNTKENFFNNYNNLITEKEISAKIIDDVIQIIAMLLVIGDSSLTKMAYYLSIHLGIITKDYTILRDISARLRYYPVTNLVNRSSDDSDTNPNSINSILSEVFSSIYRDDYYQTEEQYYFGKRIRNEKNVRAIAPTSYGKSQLMIQKCINKYHAGNKVCLIIPTKSLLSQTVSEIIKRNGNRRNVITHPDMMTSQLSSKPHISVVTQERLMSIITNFPNASYDYIFVDEAHNLFDKDQRALLLARDIIILKTRNPATHIDYYSPFIVSPEKSLDIVGVENNFIISRINEFVKVPQFYIWEEDNAATSIYDQFFDKFFDFEKTNGNIFSTTVRYSGEKNIIYANKPSDIELIADSLTNYVNEVSFCEKSKAIIEEACKSLSTLVHGSYNLIKLLKHGIVISHGRMTDIVKGYTEYLFKTVPELKYIVTTSTLLEGVNIPAEKIFIFDYGKGKGNLSGPAFHNLIGRICRFKDIFKESNPDITLLIPKVYIMQNKQFMRQKANAKNFIRAVAKEDLPQKENLLNPLLEEYNEKDKVERRIKETTILGNIDNKHYSQYEKISKTQPILAQTDFGKFCFKNGVNFFDIFSFEKIIGQKLERINTINNADLLVDILIKYILEPTYNSSNKEWIYKIFTNNTAKERILEILRNRTSNDYNFAQLVAIDIKRWQSSINTYGNNVVYVGKIGDCNKKGISGPFNNYHMFNVDKNNLMASYAVSLEKENLDNIDYDIMPIVETLNDLGKIDEILYKRLKYGTDNPLAIDLIKLGVDLSLANIIVASQTLAEMFEKENDSLVCIDKDELLERMNAAKIPKIYIKSVEDLL